MFAHFVRSLSFATLTPRRPLRGLLSSGGVWHAGGCGMRIGWGQAMGLSTFGPARRFAP